MSLSTHLPYELWELCWGHIKSRDDFRSLTLVCATFRDICQPYLFRDFSIEFWPPRYLEDSSLRWKCYVLSNLIAEPRFAKMVREAQFMVYFGRSLEDNVVRMKKRIGLLYRRIHHIWAKNLHLFTNLTTLEFQSYKINKRICKQMGSLDRLSQLSLKECDIVGRGDVVLRHLKSFDYDQPLDDPRELCDDAHQLLPTDTLDDIRLQNPDIASTYIGAFVRAKTVFSALTRLHVRIEGEPYHNLFQMLEACLELEELFVVSHFEISPDLPDKLAAGYLPKLRDLGGPTCLIPLLVHGRPIQALTICPAYRYMPSRRDHTLLEALSATRHSTSSILKLTLPSVTHTSKVMAALPDLFPCLVELSYSAFDCQFDEREREEEEQGDDSDDELDAFRNDSDSDMDFLLADIDSDIEFESEDSGTKAEVDDGYEKVGGRSPHAELEVFNDLKTDATPTLLSLSRETNGKVASLKVLTDIADDLKIGAPLACHLYLSRTLELT